MIIPRLDIKTINYQLYINTLYKMAKDFAQHKLEDFLENKLEYSKVTDGKSKEVMNFAQIACFLSKFGFECIKINSDKHGADMLAYQIDKGTTFQIQMKGRPVLKKEYENKDLYICYIIQTENTICFYKHDEALKLFIQSKSAGTKSWLENGTYSWSKDNTPFDSIINKYRLHD